MRQYKLFGAFTATEGDRPTKLVQSAKGIALICYLIVTGETHSREHLADLLWDTQTRAGGLKHLRQLLARIRPISPELQISRKQVTFEPTSDTQIDYLDFHKTLDPDPIYAITMSTNELLAGFYLSDAPRFNEWLLLERERVRHRVETLYNTVCKQSAEKADWQQGIRTARRWLAADEINETALRWLMQFLAANGEPDAAMQTFEQGRKRLWEMVRVAPEYATQQLAETIAQQIKAPTLLAEPSQKRDRWGGHTLPHPAPLPPSSLVPFRRYDRFVGRERDLLRIAASLLNQPVSSTPPVVILHGMGGVGKTQIAVEFAFRFGRFFESVHWISFANPDDVLDGVAATGSERGLRLFRADEGLSLREQADRVCQSWQKSAERLLIFDNCEAVDLLTTWLPVTGGCRILVTSRRAEWSPTLNATLLPLEPLSRQHSIVLLKQLASSLTPDTADGIASEVGDLPLALHLAGSFLHRYRTVAPITYLNQLRDYNLIGHPSLQGRGVSLSPTQHALSVSRTFQISYEQLNSADPTDQLALRLLIRIACCAPSKPLPQFFLRLLVYPAAPADDLLAELNTTDALARLLSFGFVAVKQNENVVMHRLIAEFVLAQSTQSTADARNNVAATMRDLLQAQLRDAGELHRLPIPVGHIQHVVETGVVVNSPAAAALATIWAKYFLENDMGQRAQDYLARAVPILREHERDFADDFATALTFAGGAKMRLEGAAAVLPIFTELVELNIRQHGRVHLKTGKAVQNLGVVHTNAYNVDLAAQAYQQALQIYEQLPSDRNIDLRIGRVYLNWAIMEMQRSRFQIAKQHCHAALARYKKWVDPHNSNIAEAVGVIGLCAYRTGDYEIAVDYLRRDQEIMLATLGKENLAAARCSVNLGAALARIGRYDEAQPLLESAVDLLERLSPRSASTAYGHTRLGELYLLLNQSKRAHALLTRAVDGFNAASFIGWELDEAQQLLERCQP